MLANIRWRRINWGTVMNISRAAAAAASQAGPVPGTGGPRSEGTRRAILGAARAMFAARGYEGTTIRAVAAQAGIDASMVMRYFRSKAGLFTAAVTMDLQVPDLGAVPASRRGELLVRHFISRWEDPARDDELIALMRTAVTSETVAGQLQAVLSQLITEPIADLGDERAGERGAFIVAQLLGLALCRYILRLEPLASLPSEDVVAAVAPSVQRYLSLPHRRSADGVLSVGLPAVGGLPVPAGRRSGRLGRHGVTRGLHRRRSVPPVAPVDTPAIAWSRRPGPGPGCRPGASRARANRPERDREREYQRADETTTGALPAAGRHAAAGPGGAPWRAACVRR